MKRILAAFVCILLLSSCGPAANPPAEPTAAPVSEPETQKTMITPSSGVPSDAMTVLGEANITLDGQPAAVKLATSAERDPDGYMMWDDSQQWTLSVTVQEQVYVLFDSNIHGSLYFDVTTDSGEPKITLIQRSTVGLGVTEYTYSDGAFYAERIITPPDNGNNIYSSIPDYI